MKEKIKKATGPITEVGKKRSSQNSLKTSIFSKGYLAWEDQESKQVEFERLTEQWHAYDPSRQMILRSIEHAFLSQERLMYSERKRIDGIMMSVNIAKIFYERAGLDRALFYSSIPSWYFMEEGHTMKIYAGYIKRVLNQAIEMQNFYNDVDMEDAHLNFKDLYDFLTENQYSNDSLSRALSSRYKLPNDLMNLKELVQEIMENYAYHLAWAKDPKRYETIIAGIRAEQMQEALDLEKSTRYATNFQNRIMKGFQTLVALSQYEREQHQDETFKAPQMHPSSSQFKEDPEVF